MSPTLFESSLQRVRDGTSAVELIHSSSPKWPYRLSSPQPSPTLPISVLDSSFNPPTLAHLALASAPAPTTSIPYTARLLLLSVRNADKQLKPGDAVYVQRMEMMVLLAQELEDADSDANVAVAIIDEPTFVGKSRVLLDFLHRRLASANESSPPPPKVQLTFLQGFDTIERVLAPRYYGSPEQMRTALSKFFAVDGDDSRIVCARRAAPYEDAQAREEHEQTVLQPVEDYLREGKVTLIDIDDELQTFSSTDARTKASMGDDSWGRLVPRRVAEYIAKQKLYFTVS